MTTQDQIYEALTKQFASVAEQLEPEGKVDLDGKLWALAKQLEWAGAKKWPPEIS